MHDPFWVITSDLAPVERDVSITALTVIGDGAKFHMHTAYVGFGAPIHQIEARPLLDAENPTWIAGQRGGRPLVGLWQADSMRMIRGVALAPDGKLWVAEGDGYPKRFSVWDTSGQEGKMVRELFGPAEHGAPGAAINPLDPDVMFAQGCEWRIDRKTGEAACLGVVTRDPVKVARYGVGENGHAYLVIADAASPAKIFERLGDGDYKLRSRFFHVDAQGVEMAVAAAGSSPRTMYWSDANGDGVVQPDEVHPAPWPAGPPLVATQDLTLQFANRGSEDPPRSAIARVKDWTACGAPLYDSAETQEWAEVWHVSPDRSIEMTLLGGKVIAYDPKLKKELWTIFRPDFKGAAQLLGSAALPKPLGNVWLASQSTGPWHLINEDGFDLASFFGGDPAKNPPAGKATPGIDMTHAASGWDGSITQAADGKLYIQAGDTAYWNLEVTGLDKVMALPGGSVAVPAVK